LEEGGRVEGKVEETNEMAISRMERGGVGERDGRERIVSYAFFHLFIRFVNWEFLKRF